MEWFLILSAFVVGEISGMWLPARRGNEGDRPVHNQVAKVRQSRKAHGGPILVKPKPSGSGTVER